MALPWLYELNLINLQSWPLKRKSTEERKEEKNETKFIMQDTPTVMFSNTWSNVIMVHWNSRHKAERRMRLKMRFFTRRKLIYLRLACLQLRHSHAVTQEISHSLRNSQYHCRIHKPPPMVPNQNWLYPANTLPHYIVLPSTPRSPKSSLALSVSDHVTPRIAAQIFRRFGGSFCLHHQRRL
jgi:hypothetical protein